MQRFAAAILRDVLYYEASFGRERPTVSSVAARPDFNGNFVPKAKGATCGFIFLKISILTSEPKSGIHREPDVALFHFKVGDSRFSLRDCQRPAGAGHATCERGSRDLRARVTRPAGAGRATCGRGSLTICRSETGMTQSGMAIPDIKNRESLMKIGKVLMENRESLTTIGKARKQPQKDRTLLATCGLL